ncbi:MAG: methyl-accepting chemotaxis protein [Lachnospiraceae bacterium]|nr:methyl-accepting chemotaxis protein [Lachnospiraceae bacterium]
MNDVVSEELTSGKGRFKFHLILFGVLGLFLMLGYGQMIIMISNFTDRQFKALNEMAERIAEGDVDVECKQVYKDDFGDLIGKFKIMVDNIKHQAEVAARMTEGDLTVDITPNSDRDALGNSLKKLLKQDNYVLGNINESANQVFVGADQVASASQSLAQGSTEQASAIEQVSASIVDIAEKTRVNASDAGTASELVNSAKGQAVSGSKQMNEMMEAMEDINRSSEDIYKIIKVIDDIAFQTNILALNAAVEAARAGSHGKGFAVVADEVRNLAGKSATAASETAELIEDSIAKISNGSKLAAETKDALEQIVKSVEDIVTIVDRIAIASNEQATAIAQVDQAVSQVSQVVQTNSATSEQCAAASEELSAQAENLRMLIGRFKLKKQYGGGFEEELTIDLGDEPDEPIYAIEQNTFEYSGDTGKY